MAHRHMGQEVGKEAPLVGKGPEKGRRLEGKDWISVFFLMNLCAALEKCRRHSEGLFFDGDTLAAPFHPPLRGAGRLLPFISNGPSPQIQRDDDCQAFCWQFSGVEAEFTAAFRAELLAPGPWDVLWTF